MNFIKDHLIDGDLSGIADVLP